MWRILEISDDIVSQPEPMARIAKVFINTSIKRGKENALYQANLEELLEIDRLDQLSALISAFARVIEHYGIDTAGKLYAFADKAFIELNGRLWSIWRDLFTAEIEIYFPITKYLGEAENRQLIEIVRRQASILDEKRKKINEQVAHKFSEGTLVNIDNGIERICAIRIWQEVNDTFDNMNKEKIYKWGYDNADYLTTKEEWASRKSDFFQQCQITSPQCGPSAQATQTSSLSPGQWYIVNVS